MKTITSFFILAIILTTNACQEVKKEEEKTNSKTTTNTYWVNSYKKECSGGAGKMQCLLVSKSENLKDASWEFFYEPIADFTFKPAYFQQIKVEETSLDLKSVPADASSIQYRLLETLKEEKDMSYALHDIWVVENMNENAIAKGTDHPRLEINLTKMKIYGNDSCNELSGEITKFTEDKISFENIALTRKMCRDMKIPNTFKRALLSVRRYHRENLKLRFYDEKDNEVLQLQKTD
ncbi:DUF4377 domain-containing protein [Mesonia ostreae]|uniref:DUF4377 domain-containing protein n=1 Tax=Mesonia ostreae TaxID=861110 RepID=A0ABU2KH03_9FLAO|nr:DUF4377 domain-containing protein [Mesonia ostreae]MDT0293949.1 DUF4377 domain-containing protein [Mesonia ostreae]